MDAVALAPPVPLARDHPRSTSHDTDFETEAGLTPRRSASAAAPIPSASTVYRHAITRAVIAGSPVSVITCANRSSNSRRSSGPSRDSRCTGCGSRRRARHCDACCARFARYRRGPPFRATSRLTVDPGRPSDRAICAQLNPCASPAAIRRRSSNPSRPPGTAPPLPMHRAARLLHRPRAPELALSEPMVVRS
nr:hypothetical protein GCM10025732_33930 [Glycomyces mayteni]